MTNIVQRPIYQNDGCHAGSLSKVIPKIRDKVKRNKNIIPKKLMRFQRIEDGITS